MEGRAERKGDTHLPVRELGVRGRRNTRTAELLDCGLSNCDRSGLQNSGVGDTTSMLQDKRLLNGRTIENSDCGTADYRV